MFWKVAILYFSNQIHSFILPAASVYKLLASKISWQFNAFSCFVKWTTYKSIVDYYILVGIIWKTIGESFNVFLIKMCLSSRHYWIIGCKIQNVLCFSILCECGMICVVYKIFIDFAIFYLLNFFLIATFQFTKWSLIIFFKIMLHFWLLPNSF